MGINAEMVRLIANIRSGSALRGGSVIEIGAQDVCVVPDVISRILQEYAIPCSEKSITNAKDLYSLLGYADYQCIDASGIQDALLMDLNNDIREFYGFFQEYDLVTNLGTAEHCFNQFSVFKNLHDLCKLGGLMVHALPAQGNVNHGFYNYHPRFFLDLAVANGYDIVDLSFTVDYRSRLIKYSRAEFEKWDSHDLLFYAVFRKINNDYFSTPFDGMFAKANKVVGYFNSDVDPLLTEFSPYLKGGRWENTKGYDSDFQSSYKRLTAFLARFCQW
ncbi:MULTISPECIES: hypothetical protein [Methylomonas]|uniref:Methyltransferase type 11 domain-containing protein n=2 Tax=Methylomonas TaxID=416 RepID=A0A140E3X3_9GAMM|nr:MULTISPECIES: hypothetical protein [Methylomonas]AMK75097.1 hypothetical protein JT25_001130 [Methylomonas denitrificans]OAI02587.1 hypothetical protein A1342_02120 [Methylomonas methanica]TCV83088.1 hypothetical protein EDE11_11043 [Methylomonas methanica]